MSKLMQVVQIKDVVEVTGSFVAVRFNLELPDPTEGRPHRTKLVGGQVVLPKLTAPKIGELAVFLSNRTDRPSWMRSPLLCYLGQSEAMGRRNDGGLWPCRLFKDAAGKELGWAMVTPRMGDDPMFQRWVHEYDDLSEILTAIC